MTYAAPLAPSRQRRILLPFAICTIVWGSTWFVITSQLHYQPAIWSIVYRFALGAAGMFAVARAMGVPLRLAPAAHRLAALIGVCQFVLNYVFVYAAEGHIASGLVALVSALLLVPNALLGWLFLGQKVSRRFLVGSALAIAGIALLFADALARSGHAPGGAAAIWRGVALTLCGVAGASVANILQATRAARTWPAATLLAWAMAYGAAGDLLLALAGGTPPRLPWSWTYLAGLLYLALVGSTLTFSLYFALIRRIGPARAGYTSVLIPIVAMALSTLFEGYAWSLPGLAGAALALAGLVVAIRARSPAR